MPETTVSAKITGNIAVIHTTLNEPNDSGKNTKRFGMSSGYRTDLSTIDLDAVYVYRGITTPADPVAIDLSGTLEGPAGEDVIFTIVKGLEIVNHSDAPLGGETATDAPIVMSGSWIDSIYQAVGVKVTIRAGEKQICDYNNCGRPVINGSADTVAFVPTGDSAYFDFIIIGETA